MNSELRYSPPLLPPSRSISLRCCSTIRCESLCACAKFTRLPVVRTDVPAPRFNLLTVGITSVQPGKPSDRARHIHESSSSCPVIYLHPALGVLAEAARAARGTAQA